MIIYYIKNLINNKYYVGQTVHPKFNLRYSGGRWWDITNNQYLKNAAAKYGKENFEVKILEENVENQDKLNELEKFYAEKYNSYLPNGYNLVECGGNKGRKLLSWQKELIGKNSAKTYILRKIDTWELVEITNLTKYCRENGLKDSGMYNMIKKRDGVLACNGFCLPETTKEQIRDKDKRKFRGKKFELVKDGQNYILEDIKSFCKQHNLEKGSLMKLLNEQMLYYKGFRLKSRTNEKPTKQKYYSFISPRGEIFSGYNITKFAKSQNLNIGSMIRLMAEERTIHLGWKRNPDFTPPNENNTQSSPDIPVSPPAPSPTPDS
jgi:hypothetical protein